MVIMGLDPGTATCGYGIIETSGRTANRLSCIAYGAIRTRPETALPIRLQKIHENLQTLLQEYKPEGLAVEELFFSKNASSALAVGQARGICLLVAAQQAIPVSEYTPLQVKMALTGNGRAAKEQVAYMVRILLSLPQVPTPDDAADALAVAICHAHSLGTKSVLAGGQDNQGVR